jgi:hypothetical protein
MYVYNLHIFSEMIGNVRNVEHNVAKKDVPITVFNKSSMQITMSVTSYATINLSAVLSFAVKLHWQAPFCL